RRGSRWSARPPTIRRARPGPTPSGRSDPAVSRTSRSSRAPSHGTGARRPPLVSRGASERTGIMFEKMRIKEHMEVADSNGQHVGTVDEVDGDAIKLTRSDSSDEMHHSLAIDDIESIDDNRIYLKAGARVPSGLGTSATRA